jgi:hypothetical protein
LRGQPIKPTWPPNTPSYGLGTTRCAPKPKWTYCSRDYSHSRQARVTAWHSSREVCPCSDHSAHQYHQRATKLGGDTPSLHSIFPHLPACGPQQCRDPPVAVAAILTGQSNNRSRQRIFIHSLDRQVALRSTPLIHQSASMALGEFMLLPRMLNRTATSFRAWKIPSAISFRTCFSSDSSATTRLSFAFAFSSSFSRFA